MITPKLIQGKECLLGKKYALFDSGIIVPRDIYDAWGEPADLSKMLTLWGEEHPECCNKDWLYALSTGRIRSKRGMKPTVIQSEPIEPLQQPVAWSHVTMQPELFLTIIMALVGIGSAIMSAYHTTTFLYTGGKPFWTSFITGTMLIFFSATAFTAARYFKKNIFVAALFVVAGIAVIVYSMFSTVTVNYEQFKWKDERIVERVIDNSAEIASHEHLIEENDKQLKELEDTMARLEGEADYWRNQSWRRYDAFQADLAEMRIKREELREVRATLERERPLLIQEAEKGRQTIYSFLARLLKLPEDIARFFVFVIPATLYDILAPFSLTVTFMLAERRRKHET